MMTVPRVLLVSAASWLAMASCGSRPTPVVAARARTPVPALAAAVPPAPAAASPAAPAPPHLALRVEPDLVLRPGAVRPRIREVPRVDGAHVIGDGSVILGHTLGGICRVAPNRPYEWWTFLPGETRVVGHGAQNGAEVIDLAESWSARIGRPSEELEDVDTFPRDTWRFFIRRDSSPLLLLYVDLRPE